MGKGAKTKGYIKNLATGGIKHFKYNPTSYNTGRTVTYTEITGCGSSYPKFQYVGGSAKSISLDLFLYGFNGEPKDMINFLNSFLPIEKSGVKFVKPPLMLFAFGNYIKKCILEDFSESYLEFNEDLSPRSVQITLQLKVVN